MSLTLKMKALVEGASFTGFSQGLPVRKIRRWKTDIVKYDSEVEQRGQVLDRPIREWLINWSLMDKAGRDKVREIFDAARGSYDTFLWLDDDEYLASVVSIATDGSDTTYQLKAVYYTGETYEWSEDKKDIVPGSIYAPVVTHSIDGAQTEVPSSPGANQYTLDDTTGVLTFGAAPSAGVLTCTFEYYFRVRFAEDVLEDTQMASEPLYDYGNLRIMEVL